MSGLIGMEKFAEDFAAGRGGDLYTAEIAGTDSVKEILTSFYSEGAGIAWH